MTKEDAEAVARLFSETDPETFPSLFSPPEAFAGYVSATCERGGFLSTGNVRVAEEGGEIAGICVTYSEPPARIGCGQAGVPELGEEFDHAVEAQVADAEAFVGEGFSYVDCLSVDKDHRRQGVGRALMRDAQERHSSLVLLCRTDNDAASSLYSGAGFRPIGMTLGLSEDGAETAPMMTVFAWSR